jgi:hypothetical protein
MRGVGVCNALAVAAVLGGCAHTAPSVPLAQPSLVSVELRGAQVCGDFATAADGTLSFACTPLPTQRATGWQLTPDTYADLKEKRRPNQTALIRVTTAKSATLDVVYKPPKGPSWPLRAVPAGRYALPPTVSQQAIEVASADDVLVRTWTVRVRTESCRDVTPLEFRAIGPERQTSDPLVVTLVRAPSSERCAASGGTGGVLMGSTTPAPAPPTPTTAACASGSARELVMLCLQCPAKSPSGLWDAEIDEVCSPSNHLAQRRLDKPDCYVFPVGTLEACFTP